MLGVVLLWLFGAMPHWVRRREELAHGCELVETDARELVLSARSTARSAGSGPSSAGLLGRPRTAALPMTATAGGGRAQGKAPEPHPAVAPRRAPAAVRGGAVAVGRRRRPSPALRAAVLVLGCALVVTPSVLLLSSGAPVVTAALAGVASVVVALVTLRLRARRRAVARTAVLRRVGAGRPLSLVEARRPERDAAGTSRRPQQQGVERRQAVGA